MEKVPADAVNPIGETVTKETVTELKKIGGEWVNLQRTIEKTTKETTGDATVDWKKVFDAMEADGKKAAAEVGKALDEMAKSRTVDIKVRDVVARSEGGPIQKFARGGRLPGYGGGDRISALLEAGEFVVRKEAVAKWGAGFFAALNSLRLPDVSAFNAGGMAGPGAPADGVSSAPVNITLNYSGGGSQADAKRMMSMVVDEFKRQWRARS